MSTRTYDPLINIVGALHRAQYRYGTNELDYAIERTEEVIRVRGRRLQLEGSGIPTLQFGVLRILSVLIVMSYTYLTLDRPEVTASVLGRARLFTEMQVLNHAVTTATPATTTLLGMTTDSTGVWLMDSTLGVRILFAIIVGTLVSFNSLAVDTGADSLQLGAASRRRQRDERRHRRNAGGLQPPLPRRVQDRVRDRDRFIETAPRDAVPVL
jgi:hypothetical protein